MRKIFYIIISFFVCILPLQTLAADNVVDIEDLIGNDDTYVYLKNSEMSGTKNDSFNFEVFERVELLKFALPSCAENPPDLLKCTPYICKVDSKLGAIYTKIKGMKDGSCQYIERNLGVDGVDCKFKEEDLPKLQKLFAKRFKRLTGRKVELSNDDYVDLEAIFKAKCSLMPDFNENKPISLAKINRDEIDPEFGVSDLSKYSITIPSKNRVKAKNMPKSENEEYIATLKNYRSIMLKPSEEGVVGK